MISAWLKLQPEIALFASLAIGYLIGSFRIGPIQLGGVCGTLIVALLLGQLGVRLTPDLKNIAFALFIFALGFTGGPQFFANIGSGWRYGLLSIVEIVSVLSVVMVAVAVLHLDAGTAAGLVAGAATESAVVGTASEAVAKLGLAGAETAQLQANIVTAYSVCYLFGILTIVLLTSQFSPLLLRVNLRDEAERLWRELGGDDALSEGQRVAAPALVGRAFRVVSGANMTIAAFEKKYGNNLTVEQVERDGAKLLVEPQFVLAAGDLILVFGRRAALIAAASDIGPEIAGRGLEVVVWDKVDVVLTRREVQGLTIAQARELDAPENTRGVYIAAVTRQESTIPALPDTELKAGDVLTLVGAKSNLAHGARQLGYVLATTEATDLAYLGLGVLVGIAIGHLSGSIGGVSIALGTGGGCLLSGLLFGWVRSRYPLVGSLPSAAAQVLKDFGLAAFIAAVGLSAGPDAIKLLSKYGLALPLVGVLMVLVPGLLSLWLGHALLKLDAPMLLGAIAGQQCSTPAISALVSAAGNSTPVIGYTITYALSNILLPLMGPVVVGLVGKLG
ncbi:MULTISPECIES: aspartate-alanine antiporter [Burkholderia]|uniref:aspartate-alanine antiporter n=1 Tax=Burkholderia TaxID=32008 RepID=UPI000754074B|nr:MULTISPECIES: aspartate-alanine antiporter [Burkholderia]AOJ73492.1 aspartate-alanine antiporter [Burkholderia savannae]KVG49137.1 aspartate-alanine antiporter [Burkholderia sp. MSMB0265]KVG85879.1 aspartate-alanine antiporter [Burkholderia sp. MSMB2040]KVG92019.1 aspartate-alanine antiporter [Burkholderia sp. MSMB2042]KVG97032.1 aspartate-alanine antiporter [Burkholderia sp. MSMB2041]